MIADVREGLLNDKTNIHGDFPGNMLRRMNEAEKGRDRAGSTQAHI